MRKTALKEGSCFKAVRVACNRNFEQRMDIMAEEIHIVVDDDKHETASHIETDARRFADRSIYEKRKIITSASFDMATPKVHLKLSESENGTKIIDVTRGSLKSKYFPPMRYAEGKGYLETKAADVLFGLDLAEGSPWVTPIAFQHVQKVQECVSDAGGIFVAEFDTTVGGWAKFRSVYVCPAPSKTVYVQACKVKASSRFFRRTRDIVPSLSSSGGVLFKQAFEPTETGMDDPVIFNDLNLSLLSCSP